MLLTIGWTIFGAECLLSLGFGLMFSHFWSHAAMTGATKRTAVTVYALGCALCLLVAIAMPL